MIDIEKWMNIFLSALKDTFAERVWFVGLQGSYGRNEATATSDIDVVVILDALSVEDIRKYRDMLELLPYRELVCGFLSGKNELFHWEASDLFQFCLDTTPIFGSIDSLFSLLNRDVVERAIKIGVCNVYHACVHNILHEKSEEILRGLYKSASFTVQALVYLQTGRYVKHLIELLKVALDDEKMIVETFMHLKTNGAVDFEKMSETLFKWCQKWICD